VAQRDFPIDRPEAALYFLVPRRSRRRNRTLAEGGGGGRVSKRPISYPLAFAMGYYIRAANVRFPRRRLRGVLDGCSIIPPRGSIREGWKPDDERGCVAPTPAVKIKALAAMLFGSLTMQGCAAERYTFPVLSATRFHSVEASSDDYETDTKTSLIADPTKIARVVRFMNAHRFGWREKRSFWEDVAGEGAPYVTVDLYESSRPNAKADWNSPYLVSTRQTFWRGDGRRRFYLNVSQDDRKQLCAVLGVKCSSGMLAP
jgi:hypothetical protein